MAEPESKDPEGLIELGPKGVLRITREAWKEAPPGIKAALYAPAIGSFIGAVVIGLLYLSESPQRALFIFLTFLIIALVLVTPHFMPLRLDPSLRIQRVPADQNEHGSPVSDLQSTGHTPGILALDAKEVASLRSVLDDACKECAKFLRSKVPALVSMTDDRIRANVFAPDDGVLRLDPRLAVNMNHPPELTLKFRADQGATGLSFSTGNYCLTRRLPSDAGDWDRKQRLTPELKEKIHKNLKWIYSFPIRAGGSGKIVGVLNIDGLVDVPDDEILHQMAANILGAVEDIGDFLCGLDKSVD